MGVLVVDIVRFEEEDVFSYLLPREKRRVTSLHRRLLRHVITLLSSFSLLYPLH